MLSAHGLFPPQGSPLSSPRRRRDERRRPLVAAALLLAQALAGAQLDGVALDPDDLAPIAQFGAAVALHDDVAVVGAPFHDAAGPAAGAVFVQRLVDGTWQPEALLTVAQPTPTAFVGHTLAFDGSTLVTGATGPGDGGVYVFHREVVDGRPAWTQEARLLPDAPAADYGFCVDVDGDTLVVGTFESLGRVFVYERDGGRWQQSDVLQPDDLLPGDAFGSALALCGDVLVVGAPRSHVDAGPGRVFVFRRVDGAWTGSGMLASDVPPLHGGFGYALALDDARCVVGAYESEDSGAQPGQAWVFRDEGGAFVQEAELRAALDHVPASFGQSVALAGDLAVVGAFSEAAPAGDGHATHDGAYEDDGDETSGVAYTFQRVGPLWPADEVLVPAHPEEDDQFARALAAWDRHVLVGAPRQHQHGEAYVFDVPPLLGTWVALGGATAGSAGTTPTLRGHGGLQPGSAFGLELAHALAAAPAFLVVGQSVVPQPFHGGTLVPALDALATGLVLDARGGLQLAGRWPPGLRPGDVLAFQAWVVDAAAPHGLAASGALAAVAP